MITLSITPDLEKGPWTDLKHVKALGKIERIGRLPRGTVQGQSTVCIGIRMPDGTIAVGETTLALIKNATDALAAVDAPHRTHVEPHGKN
jgi:hypothetical protein